MVDLVVSTSILVVLALAALVFGVVTALGGRRKFDRVEREGTSVLLGRGPMELAHFSLEPLGRAAVAIGLSANAITLVSLLLGLGAGVAIALGHFGVGCGLSTVSALFDTLDGMVARLTKTSSDSGETFDAAVDRYNEFFFLAGLAYVFRQDARILVLVLAALLGSFMVSYATAKAEALRVKPPRGAMRRAERATYLTLGVGLVPISMRFAQSGLAGIAPVLVALALVAIVGNVSAARRIFAVARLAAERDHAAPAAPSAAESAPAEPAPVEIGAAAAPAESR
ncbi:MAG: CDP-alcohol phosphatidyltransferase family protein [Polyangiaceae bacterium]